MLIAINAKQEYEAIELLKIQKEYLEFIKANSKNILNINLKENIIELATAGNLFSENSIYFVSCLLEEEINILSQDIASICLESRNLFMFYGKNKSFKDKCALYEIKLIDKKEENKNQFPQEYVNALQKKDKKSSWQLYLKEIENKNIEEVYGVTVYSYKNLLIAHSMSKYDEKSGLKEFQYRQIKKNLEDRKILIMKINLNTKNSAADLLKEDLEKSYFELVNLYAKTRRESKDLSLALEQWILS